MYTICLFCSSKNYKKKIVTIIFRKKMAIRKSFNVTLLSLQSFDYRNSLHAIATILGETPYVGSNLRSEYVILVAIAAVFTTESGVTNILYLYLIVGLFLKCYHIFWHERYPFRKKHMVIIFIHVHDDKMRT